MYGNAIVPVVLEIRAGEIHDGSDLDVDSHGRWIERGVVPSPGASARRAETRARSVAGQLQLHAQILQSRA